MAQFPSTELPWKPSVKYLTTLYPRNLASPRQSWISADVLLKCIKDIPPRLALWLREAESGWDKILLVTRYAISCQGVWALLCVLLSSCSKEEGKLTIWSWQKCRGKERASGTRGWSICSYTETHFFILSMVAIQFICPVVVYIKPCRMTSMW